MQSYMEPTISKMLEYGKLKPPEADSSISSKLLHACQLSSNQTERNGNKQH